MTQHRTEQRQGLLVEWDAPIRMDDGVELRADVFRPVSEGRYPVIITYGPYGKGVAFQDPPFKPRWDKLAKDVREVQQGTSAIFACWELLDPELWVPHGYVLVRVDARGQGTSPGVFDAFSPREMQDFHDCIEWAGAQPWSNGAVGISGISWYAMDQWLVASKQPPSLKAMCAWEGAADSYRDFTHHGGILCTFGRLLSGLQMQGVQHGQGERGPRSRATGALAAGPETLSPEELAANRRDIYLDHKAHPLDDAYHRDRSPDWSRVTTPFLSCGNWGGQGLHLRGNVEAFVNAASADKWLEVHGLEHWTDFYTAYGQDLQRRFFDHFLKGEDNGWRDQPRVQLKIRHPGDRFTLRAENEWPLARTDWTRFYLDLDQRALTTTPPAAGQTLAYDALGDGVTFLSEPMAADTEITGPSAFKATIASSTTDADLFVVLSLFDPDGREVNFVGANDDFSPLSLGWLRASHRKLDAARSTPYRPYHPHDEVWPLTPGEAVEVDVEIWPTSIVAPAGWRIGLTVRGKDYVSPNAPPLPDQPTGFEPTGVTPLFHNDPEDRPTEIFGGSVTLQTSAEAPAFVLLPVIPQA